MKRKSSRSQLRFVHHDAQVVSLLQWRDVKVTLRLSQEAERLSTALKDAEFRKLLVEYAQEISDPANKEVSTTL